MLSDLKCGDTVRFQISARISGVGRVIGIALVEQAVIGRMLIIHAPEIKSELYPWEAVAVPELMCSRFP